jgi:di/tricarboxylate transporter
MAARHSIAAFALAGLVGHRYAARRMAWTWDIALVFLITAITFVLFATERLRSDVLALSVLCVLGLVGYFRPQTFLSPQELLSCFSDPAPITVAAMFVLGAGLTRTGALDGLARLLERMAERGEGAALLAMMAAVVPVSAVLNNTAVVTFFLPVLLHLCAQKQIPPSRMLIPLSYAAMLGGTVTLIGTSTNIVVNNVALRLLGTPIGMFEPTKMGVLFALTGAAYILLVGRRLLPARETLTSLLASGHGKEYRTEVVVLRSSPLIGQTLGEVRQRHLRAGTIIGVTRDGEPLDPPFDRIRLQEGDRIIVNLALSGVREVQAARGIALLPEAELGVEQIGAEETVLVEAIVPNHAPLQGKTLREVDFVHRHGVRILAMHRHGMNVRERFEDVPLRFGDTLLLQGTEEAIRALRDDRELLLLSPLAVPVVRRHKRWVALAIVAGVMIGASVGHLTVANVALVGALLLVLTRCLEMNEVYEAINWNIIMLIAGMLGLGLAMEKTGGARFIAERLHGVLGGFGPQVALAGTYLVAMLLTEMVSNNAVAALMTPIAITSAQALQCDPRPFVMAVMFAASASFSTPIGYQTNTMIFGAGGYKFTDFFKIGAPLNLLLWILASVMIPIFWPL